MKLKIGKLKVPVPIIQGGMAVRISTANLAAAVANEGVSGLLPERVCLPTNCAGKFAVPGN